MSAEDWYRNTSWNEAIAREFEARLKRARRKAQYLRIQACTLAGSYPQVALQLLDRYFELGDDFDYAQAYVDQATAYCTLGQVDNALKSYEQALHREAMFPNLLTQAYLDLPFLIATIPIPARFDQAQSLLDQFSSRLFLPVDFFRWNAAYALILAARSQAKEASQHAEAALEAAAKNRSGFRYHKTLGLVAGRYPDLLQKLKNLTHAA